MSITTGGNMQTGENATDKITRIIEGSLAFPGRDKVDPRASYFFHNNDEYRRDVLRSMYNTAFRPKVTFHQLVAGKQEDMQESMTFARQAWVVGVAANPWRVIKTSLKIKLAHWGIYIRPKDTEEPASYCIFGMNFLKEFGGELVLEDVWGTPGPNGTGEWKRLMTSEEFHQVHEPGLEEVVMYFSLEEFVLELQRILRGFVLSLNRPAAIGQVTTHPGIAYSLLFSNCQHFVKTAMGRLKYWEWTDQARMTEAFSLTTFKGEIEDDLMREREIEAKEEKYIYETFQLELSGNHDHDLRREARLLDSSNPGDYDYS